MIAPNTSLHDELEIYLSLRELLNRNHYAEEFDNDTLAELLYREHLAARRVEAHEVEAAREALLNDGELLA